MTNIANNIPEILFLLRAYYYENVCVYIENCPKNIFCNFENFILNFELDCDNFFDLCLILKVYAIYCRPPKKILRLNVFRPI
jgi:hypothetical protein